MSTRDSMSEPEPIIDQETQHAAAEYQMMKSSLERVEDECMRWSRSMEDTKKNATLVAQMMSMLGQATATPATKDRHSSLARDFTPSRSKARLEQQQAASAVQIHDDEKREITRETGPGSNQGEHGRTTAAIVL